MTSNLQFMKSPRPKSTTDESSVLNEKSIRPKARSVRVQSADIVPANAGEEEGILLDKEHTTKVHPIITKEVRNSTPSDQDLIDASMMIQAPGRTAMLDLRGNPKVKGKPSKTLPLGRGFSTRRLKSRVLNLLARSSMSLNYSWMTPKEIFICYGRKKRIMK